MTSQPLQFFPRDRSFWAYHVSALALVMALQALMIIVWREHKLFNTVGNLIWLPLFTLAVLGFRWLYRQRHWERLGIAKLLPLTFAYAFTAGFFVTTLMVLVSLPIFWDSLFSPELLQKYDTTAGREVVLLMVSNTMSTMTMVAAWAVIYISVTTTRRARETMMNNLRLEGRLKEAQLTSLTNQLNPHFLFNSLNNIRFMIHENPAHADRTITALSGILRYSLESGRRDKVFLAEELDVVERYLEVMQLQLEDRLNARLNVPSELGDYLVPPMSVQLLIENAVKHGVENNKRAGEIEVCAQVANAQLQILVSNPLPPQSGDEERNTGTGLENVRQRLHLLYGQDAEMTVAQTDKQFVVTLSLPLETSEEVTRENAGH